MAIFLIAIFLGLVVIVFALILLYGTRETSYEQALEEQRNKNDFDLLTSSSTKADSKKDTKKEKNRKSKESLSKKSKEKSLTQSNKNNLKSKPQNHAEKKPIKAEIQEEEIVQPTVSVKEVTVTDAPVTNANSEVANVKPKENVKPQTKKEVPKEVVNNSVNELIKPVQLPKKELSADEGDQVKPVPSVEPKSATLILSNSKTNETKSKKNKKSISKGLIKFMLSQFLN